MYLYDVYICVGYMCKIYVYLYACFICIYIYTYSIRDVYIYIFCIMFLISNSIYHKYVFVLYIRIYLVKPRCFQITLRLVHTTMLHNSSLCSGNMVP